MSIYCKLGMPAQLGSNLQKIRSKQALGGRERERERGGGGELQRKFDEGRIMHRCKVYVEGKA
jgi:hypothetical protein